MSLRISDLGKTPSAVEYFKTQLSRGDYWLRRDGSIYAEEMIGEWGGKVAVALEVNGEVQEKEFVDLLEKRDPRDGTPLRSRKNKSKKVIPGFDLTFTLPKSLSIQQAIREDYRIVEALRKAAQDTMVEDVEPNVMVRVRSERDMAQLRDQDVEIFRKEKVGEPEYMARVGNCAWAEFIHFTARPHKFDEETVVPDPHTHVHMVVPNVAWNPDHVNRDGSIGGYMAIDMNYMVHMRTFIEARFHARFTKTMADLGYEIEGVGDRSFELAKFEPEIIDKFSNRRNTVKAEAERRGITSDRVIQELGLNAKTRLKKEESTLSWSVLREKIWFPRLSEDEKQLIEDTHNGAHYPTPPKLSAREALGWAMAHQFERESTVKMTALLESAYIRGFGSCSPDEIDEAFQGMLDEGSVFGGWIDGHEVVSHLSIYREEQFVLGSLRETRGRFPAGGSKDYGWQSELFRDPNANTLEQEEAVRQMIGSFDQIMAFVGPAGAGKTSSVREAKLAFESAGHNVFLFGAHGNARAQLEKDGFGANTLARLLVDTKLQDEIEKGDVVWLDEAGLVGAVDMARVVRLAKEKGARLVVSGDYDQHGPVARGDIFAQMVDSGQMTVSRLAEIRRQLPDEIYLKGAYQAAHGDMPGAYRTFKNAGYVRDLSSMKPKEYLGEIANDYFTSLNTPNRNGDRRSILVVSPVHSEKNAVSKAIREKLKEEQVLAGRRRVISTLENLSKDEAQLNAPATYRGVLRGGHEEVLVRFHKKVAVEGLPARGPRKPFFDTGVLFKLERVEGEQVIVSDDRGIEAALPLHRSASFAMFAAHETEVVVGERLKITENMMIPRKEPFPRKKNMRVANGEFVTVEDIGDDGSLLLGNGGVLPSECRSFTHGYVNTSIGSQGDTVDEVMVVQTKPTLGRASNMQQFYVSVTRGREALKIYTDDEERLVQRIQDDARGMTATELMERTQGQERPVGAPRGATENTERAVGEVMRSGGMWSADRIRSLFGAQAARLSRAIFGDRRSRAPGRERQADGIVGEFTHRAVSEGRRGPRARGDEGRGR